MKPVGQIIREARKKAGMTQKELADICGVVPSVICDYEKGRQEPYVSRLILIADKLGLNLGVLSKPTKIRCPKCGETCEIIYRNRHSDIVGCDVCVDALDATQDADARPEDYGLEANGE